MKIQDRRQYLKWTNEILDDITMNQYSVLCKSILTNKLNPSLNSFLTLRINLHEYYFLREYYYFQENQELLFGDMYVFDFM